MRSYYVLNSLTLLIEIIFVTFVFSILFENYFFVTVSVYITIFLVITIKNFSKNPFGEEIINIQSKSDFTDYIELIKQASELKEEAITTKFIDYKRMNFPAFYHRNIVYFNIGVTKIEDQYFEGILAHELGHAISGFANYAFFVQMRISTLISTAIAIYRNSHLQKHKGINKFFDEILYLIIRFFSILDNLFLYPYIKAEEFKANDIALELTDGHSLRTYYYMISKIQDHKHQRYDLRHPTGKEMLERMESQMNLTEYDKHVYHVNDKVYFVDSNNRTKANELKHNFYLHQACKENPHVLEQLSKNYLYGLGTKKDLMKAKEYALEAINYGSENASKLLITIYEKLSLFDELFSLLENNFKDDIPYQKSVVKRINTFYLQLTCSLK